MPDPPGAGPISILAARTAPVRIQAGSLSALLACGSSVRQTIA